MKTPRERIIEKGQEWIGEDLTYDVVKRYHESLVWELGYDQALQDLRSRLPDIADEVLGILREELSTNKSIASIMDSLTRDTATTDTEDEHYYNCLGCDAISAGMRDCCGEVRPMGDNGKDNE